MRIVVSFLKNFKVPIAVLLFFLMLELIFFNFGLLWKLPFKNSVNFSHEMAKLNLLYKLKKKPNLVILGSSWAEYGVEEKLISKRLNIDAVNLSIISSQLFEHSLIYNRFCRVFRGVPKYTVLILDYTHIPVKYEAPGTKYLVTPKEISKLCGIFSKEYIAALINKYIKIYCYRNDIKTAIFGFLTKDKKYYFYDQSIHDENIKVWESEKRWINLTPPSLNSSLNRIFKKDEIGNFIKFIEKTFWGTQLIIIDGPVAFPMKTNFPKLFSQMVRNHPWISYFDWRKELYFKSNKHFYDFDHLNQKGAMYFSEWIACKVKEI